MFAVTSWTFDVAPILTAIGVIVTALFARNIRKEQKPNAGSSMRDAIDRIEAMSVARDVTIASIVATQTTQGEAIAYITGRLQGHNDQNKEILLP